MKDERPGYNGSLIVIASYKPKKDMEEEMLEVLRDHMPILSMEDLITDFPAIVLKSKDGCYLEIFEWKSQEAINQAHQNENVMKLWKRFDEVCTYINLSDIEECKNLFASFEPVEL
jgi:quinol monooxygenase YgiN